MTYIDPNLDTRNVTDEFKGLPTEEIRDAVRSRTLGFAVAMVNWTGDFNFSSLVRSANSFGAEKVYYVSEKSRWDKRGAQGTYNYTDVEWVASEEGLVEAAKRDDFTMVALEQTSVAVGLYDYVFPERPMLVLGNESVGVSDELLSKIDNHVVIPSVGSTRSLNAAVAGSVAMSWVASKR